MRNFSWILLLLLGCYVNTNTSEGIIRTQDKQKLAENSIKDSIRSQNPLNKYESFGFGEIYEDKPIQIQKLENLITERNNLNPLKTDQFTFDDYDSKIEELKNQIRSEILYTTIELDHWYSLDSTLYESFFYLYPNYKIKEKRLIFQYKLLHNQKKYLKYYFAHKNIYKSNDYDKEFYANKKLYKQWDFLILNDTISKNASLTSVLAQMEYIDERNVFDTNQILNRIISSYIEHNFEYTNEYLPLRFHDPKKLTSSGGFEVLHEFKLDKKIKIFYFEFNSNLLITNRYVSE